MGWHLIVATSWALMNRFSRRIFAVFPVNGLVQNFVFDLIFGLSISINAHVLDIFKKRGLITSMAGNKF